VKANAIDLLIMGAYRHFPAERNWCGVVRPKPSSVGPPCWVIMSH